MSITQPLIQIDWLGYIGLIELFILYKINCNNHNDKFN